MTRAFRMRISVSVTCSMRTVTLAKLFGKLTRALASVVRVNAGADKGFRFIGFVLRQNGMVVKWDRPTTRVLRRPCGSHGSDDLDLLTRCTCQFLVRLFLD